jgi:hypothetical protein
MKKILFSSAFFLLLLGYACNTPQDIISPSHYTRVPAVTELKAVQDTTLSGKYRIALTWGITQTTNLRSFEVYRTSGTPTKFTALQPQVSVQSFVDSIAVTITDSVKLFYYVVPTGQDLFVGKNSDTITVTLKTK